MTVTTNGNGIREAAVADALAGLSRDEIAAKYARSDGWAGGVITESGRSGRMPKGRLAANGASRASGELPSRSPVPRAIAPKKTASPPRRRRGLPLPLVVLTVVAGVMVLAVTAVVSYTHVRNLAELTGQDQLAAWYPLGVDGLVAVCSGVLLWDRHAGRPVSWVARIGAMVGLVATFVANGMAYDPDLASVYVAGLILAVYPPVALAVVWHLLNRMLVER